MGESKCESESVKVWNVALWQDQSVSLEKKEEEPQAKPIISLR